MFNRRLGTAIVLAAGLGVSAQALSQPVGMIDHAYRAQVLARAKAPLSATELFDDAALRVVLCGTSAPLADPGRAKACTAVIVKGRAYLVDVGPGSVAQLILMGFPLDRIGGVFLTHYHSDHIGDLGELRMQSWAAGRAAPLSVYGPTGVAQVVAGFNQAYGLDDDYRTLHHGATNMPEAAAPLKAQSFAMAPGDTKVVYQDADLTITAFAVKHDPVKPAVGYRFDSHGRSVVVSGDTAPTPDLTRAADKADILVCESLSKRMMTALSQSLDQAGNHRQAQMLMDTLSYHIDPVDAAKTANAAHVGLLVYSHLAPHLPQPVLAKLFFDGVAEVRDQKSWVIGEDGMRIDLPFTGAPPTISNVPMLGKN